MESARSFSQVMPDDELQCPLAGFKNLRWVQSKNNLSSLVGISPRNQKELSIKVISASTHEELDTCETTLKSLQGLDHPNVSSVYDIQTSSNEEPFLIYFGTDLNEKTLADELKEKKKFTPLEALEVLYCLSHALFSVKTRLNLFHGKVNPFNIIKINESYKITNFETLQKLNNSQNDLSPKSLCSISYLAPEQKETESEEFAPQIDNFACDVFSLGMLGFELLGLDAHVLRIVSPKTKIYEEEMQKLINTVNQTINPQLGALLQSMVANNAVCRPCIEKTTESLASIIESMSKSRPSERTVELERAYRFIEEGENLYENSDLQNALECFDKFLSVVQRLNGKPSDLACVLLKIGITQFALGLIEESYKNLKLALLISTNLYGKFHADVGDALLNIARIQLIRTNYDDALKNAEEALAIWKEVQGAESIEEAQVWILIGHIYKAKNCYNKAQESILKGIEILKSRKLDETSEIADSLELLGMISCELNEPKKALCYHQNALGIRIKTLSPNHSRISNSYRCLGFTYLLMNDVNTCISLYEMALKTLRLNLGKNHPEVYLLQVEIGQEYLKTGRVKKAIELLESLEVGIARESSSLSCKIAHKLFLNLASAHKAAGNGKKAEFYAQKAKKAFNRTN